MFFHSQGAVIEVSCPSALSWDKSSNLTVGASAAGYTRASYFGGARILRAMSLEHGALAASEQAKVDAFTHLGFGAELGFTPTGAGRSNLLSPGASLLATAAGVSHRPFTPANGVLYPGGVNTPDVKRIATDLPFAFPGQKVALSAVGKGDFAFSIEWKDAAGRVLSYAAVAGSGADGYARVSRVHTAPAEAVAFGAHIRGDIAAPAMTLEKVMPWQVGVVAKSVVVESAGVKMLAAWDHTRPPLTSHSYTIKEVGDYV